MAKARKPVRKRSVKTAKKKSATARSNATRSLKRAARKPARKRAVAAAEAPRYVDLKKLRAEFGLVLSALSTRQGASTRSVDKLDDTRKRISQWMTDIDDICSPEDQEICGPDMAIPIP